MQPEILIFSEHKAYKHVALALGYYDYWINVGIARFAREHHWRIDKISAVPQGLSPQKYDGIICLLTPQTPLFMLEFVRAAEIPVVDLVDEHRELAVHRVIYDNFAIGELAAKHFWERGFERFIYYQMSDAEVELERKRGFENRINRHGFELVTFDLAASGIDYTNREDRIGWLKQQLSKLKFPVAAMTQCDANSQELLMACEEAGILLPDQLAAVGVDNDLITSELGVMPLSSIDNNRELLGFQAAKMLQALMAGEPVPLTPLKIPPKEIVIRASSDILAVENAKAAQALRFIWKNYPQDITSDTVARAVGLSRRGLFYLFQKYLHRSIAGEILKCRINEAKRLLVETNQTMDEIASLSGLKHAEHLARVFRDHLRQTPSDFRKANSKVDK